MTDFTELTRLRTRSSGRRLRYIGYWGRASGIGLPAVPLPRTGSAGIPLEKELLLPLVYKGMTLECGYRIDLLVMGKVVVEIKAVEEIDPIHEAQLLTYLRLGGWKVGLLINFNVPVLKDGIRRACPLTPARLPFPLSSLLRVLCASVVNPLRTSSVTSHGQVRLQVQEARRV